MTVAVVNFLTYTPGLEHPRVKYAQQCLRAMLENLSFNEGELKYHIADDGSPEGHVQSLVEICQFFGHEPTTSVTEHLGYGGNMNLSTQTIHSIADFVLPIEEDWELVKRLDISSLIRAMQASGGQMECVRMGYLGWTNDLVGRLAQYDNQSFLLFDPESTETHVFAGHPRIETVEFEKRVGPWPVGMKAGYTEMEICHRPEARKGVAWPLDADINASQEYCSMWAHVGDVQS